MPCTPLTVSKRHGQIADKGRTATDDLNGKGRDCATRSAGHTVPMNEPAPSSAETLLRKSSWAGFVIGAGVMVLAMTYERQAEESQARADYYRGEVAAGRLTVSPEVRYLIESRKEAPDYWEARAGGLALILVGLGCSLYANKLRKARTGE